MTRKTVTVMTAIESELQHIRAKFRAIEERMGKEAADGLFDTEVERCTLKSLNAQMTGEETTINDKVHILAISIFAFELDTQGVVDYDE